MHDLRNSTQFKFIFHRKNYHNKTNNIIIWNICLDSQNKKMFQFILHIQRKAHNWGYRSLSPTAYSYGENFNIEY